MVFAIHWHESAMDLHVFPIPIPPLTSLSTQSLWVFPVHQVQGLSHASNLGWWSVSPLIVYMFRCCSQNIPPSPSPTESKSLFCTSVSLSLLHANIFLNLFFSWRKLLYNVFFSAVQHHESAIIIPIFPPLESLPSPHPTPLGYYSALAWAPGIIQQLPTGYLFYAWWCINVNAAFSIHPTFSFPCWWTS